MRLLVCGGRDFANVGAVESILAMIRESDGIECLIHGAATGADELAREWAVRNEIPTEAYPADWAREGKAAGPLGNARMLAEAKPDFVVAFPGGRGTADMVRKAKAADVTVMQVELTSRTR